MVQKPPQNMVGRLFLQLRQSTALPDGVSPEDGAAAVLCVLATRLSAGEASHLLEGLPPSVQELLAHCAEHRLEQSVAFDRQEFLRRVGDHLQITPREAESLTRAVFSAAQVDLSKNEIKDVESQLPRDIADLWRHRPD